MSMLLFKKDPLQIITFQTYATDKHLYIKGRALEDETIDLDQKNWWQLLINTWKRFESDEVKCTPLIIKITDTIIIKSKTDTHGYFKIDDVIDDADLSKLINEEGWLKFEVSFDNVEPKIKIQNSNKFIGELLIPSKSSAFGVISDIDDTIIHTGVASILKWRVLINTFFKGVQSRIPLEGASDFYNKLHKGVTGTNANPIFYVSHSPWNLYRYLKFFLKQNNFPKGPILLRSFKSILRRRAEGEKPQKQNEILNILKTYPDLNFILIGDSGEKDADIYIELAETFPDRILAIYLRNVRHKKKMERVRQLFQEFKIAPVLLVESSKEAIQHAEKHGFIKF